MPDGLILNLGGRVRAEQLACPFSTTQSFTKVGGLQAAQLLMKFWHFSQSESNRDEGRHPLRMLLVIKTVRKGAQGIWPWSCTPCQRRGMIGWPNGEVRLLFQGLVCEWASGVTHRGSRHPRGWWPLETHGPFFFVGCTSSLQSPFFWVLRWRREAEQGWWGLES